MSLSAKEISNLKLLVRLAQALLSEAEDASRPPKGSKQVAHKPRRRRTGKELLAFRKLLKTERKAGVPVADLARKHGVSTAYIYGVN